jgi:Rab GDP dissociation inhibitor
MIQLQVEFDMEGKACGVTSEGETAKCTKVVCDPSYLPNNYFYLHISEAISLKCSYIPIKFTEF